LCSRFVNGWFPASSPPVLSSSGDGRTSFVCYLLPEKPWASQSWNRLKSWSTRPEVFDGSPGTAAGRSRLTAISERHILSILHTRYRPMHGIIDSAAKDRSPGKGQISAACSAVQKRNK
jgi:hypothetical protein